MGVWAKGRERGWVVGRWIDRDEFHSVRNLVMVHGQRRDKREEWKTSRKTESNTNTRNSKKSKKYVQNKKTKKKQKNLKNLKTENKKTEN